MEFGRPVLVVALSVSGEACLEAILNEILVSEFRYCMSSPNDPGVSAERNAVIVAKKAEKRIGQSSSKGSQKNSIVGGVAVGL